MIFEGLLWYVCLLIMITFHEFAHAWTAWKFGDDTAYERGRVSLNPVVHMDLLGTVILPLAVVFLTAADSRLASFIIGWGKPVPVNPSNLSNRRVQDTLIALAGPAMNILLAVAAMILARLFLAAGMEKMIEFSFMLALISLMLCFFNLLPVPPLDGSHVVKNAFGISDEMYMQVARYGFVILIVLIQFPIVRYAIRYATLGTLSGIQRLVGMH